MSHLSTAIAKVVGLRFSNVNVLVLYCLYVDAIVQQSRRRLPDQSIVDLRVFGDGDEISIEEVIEVIL